MTTPEQHSEWRFFRARLAAAGVTPDAFGVHAMLMAAQEAVAQGIGVTEFVRMAQSVFVMARDAGEAQKVEQPAPGTPACTPRGGLHIVQDDGSLKPAGDLKVEG